MKFQPGESGNPAGRPPGSLNKKTLAAQAAFDAHAEEVVENVVERAKNGQPAAMRLCMERFAPTGRNRPLAIDLPVIKTADDAEAAVAVVTTHLAAGDLTVGEASSLIILIERMVRLAERIGKMRQAEREQDDAEAVQKLIAEAAAAALTAAKRDTTEAPAGATQAADATGERLYSPVNQRTPVPAERLGVRADQSASSASGGAVPQAKAA
jgi:hypothetical protein